MSEQGDTGDFAHLQAEVVKLSQVVAAQAGELEMYHRAALAWAADQITQTDIERYAKEEPGLPLEAFIHELEHVGRE